MDEKELSKRDLANGKSLNHYIYKKTMLGKLYPLLLQLPITNRNSDDNSPIDLTSAFDVILYIILPVLMIIFYILWRKNKKKRGGN